MQNPKQVFLSTLGQPDISPKGLETAKRAYLACQLEGINLPDTLVQKYLGLTDYRSKYVEPLKVQATRKWLQIYESASKRGKEFNLDVSDVEALLLTEKCYYTGMPFTETNKLTIDRLNPKLGYVKGNVYAIGFRANVAKEYLLEGKHGINLQQLSNMVHALQILGFKND